MDLCLGCKACSTDCPTGVDMAEAKSELMDAHYRGRLRPFTHYAIGWLPRWLPALSRVSALTDHAGAVRVLRRLGALVGVSAHRRLPEFARTRDVVRNLREADFVTTGDVVLFVDSVTRVSGPRSFRQPRESCALHRAQRRVCSRAPAAA